MNKVVKKTLIVSLLLLLFAFSNVASADVTINLYNFFNNSPQLIYVADLDLLQTGSAPELFGMTIRNNGAPIANPRLRISLLDGSRQLIASGFLSFGVPLSTGGSWTVSNLHISRGSYSASWDVQDNLGRFQSQVLRTGMIPIDTYIFRFELGTGSDDNFVVIPTAVERMINVRGMGYAQLRFPPNDPSGAAPIPINIPMFVWQTSLDSSRFQLAELRPGESPMSAIEGRRILETTVMGNSFQYPSFGNIQLQPGRMYAWRVIGKVNTSRGLVDVPSEVSVFKVASQLTPSVNQLLVALSQLLSGGNWSSLLQMIQNGELNGELFINNQPETAQALFAIIAQVSSGDATIRSVRVE